MHANAAQVVVGTTSNYVAEIENSGLVELSNEQWQTLVDMLNNHKSTTNEKMIGKNIYNLWIIDSGASNHMTGNLKHLCELRTVQGCPVGLPDGQCNIRICE